MSETPREIWAWAETTGDCGVWDSVMNQRFGKDFPPTGYILAASHEAEVARLTAIIAGLCNWEYDAAAHVPDDVYAEIRKRFGYTDDGKQHFGLDPSKIEEAMRGYMAPTTKGS